MTDPTDAGWMARALALAERGRATCRPNPMVGCVLVRNGAVIGEGWHERAGGPHAEVAALRTAPDATGATAYVTLEPCDHEGRTGPCSHALVDAGVERVVFAAADRHPEAAGGAATLRRAGVDVEPGVLAEWAEEQNRVFFHGVATRRPHVTLKLAQTPDGMLTAPAGRWITGEKARTAVHVERALADAVVVGSGTVIADDPRLDVRHVPLPGPAPRAVVFDASGRTPVDARLVRAGGLVVTTDRAPQAWRREIERSGGELSMVRAGPSGAGLDLQAAMHDLWTREIRAILAEPGAMLSAALVRAGLVDRLLIHVGDTGTTDPFETTTALAATDDWTVRRRLPRGSDLEIERRPDS